MAALHKADGRAHPGGNPPDYLLIRPVSYNDLALNSHAAYDVSVLTVAVGRLIFIHKVHINGVIGDFLIKLGM